MISNQKIIWNSQETHALSNEIFYLFANWAHLSIESRWANILQSLLLEFGGSKHWQSCLRKTLLNLNKQPIY